MDKALSLLDYFSESQPEIGLSDMARFADFDKATTRRLLVSLERNGLVEQHRKSRAYRLGPGILRLARVREATFPVELAARPVLERLAAETGETVHLAMYDRGAMSTVSYVEGASHGTRVHFDPSERLPLHATASGLAYLAFAPDDLRENALAAPLHPHTALTETDPDRIRARLVDIRANGLGIADNSFDPEVFGVAAPLFSASGECCGAVAVATPSSRVTEEARTRTIAALRQAASAITHAWGGAPPASLSREAAK